MPSKHKLLTLTLHHTAPYYDIITTLHPSQRHEAQRANHPELQRRERYSERWRAVEHLQDGVGCRPAYEGPVKNKINLLTQNVLEDTGGVLLPPP